MDARVRYTKKIIKDSLIRLLKNTPLQKITVKEICNVAQINRATFYTHYQNHLDLLEQIENELFEDGMSIARDQFKLDSDHLTERIFEIIRTNKELCEVLFSENGDSMFLRRILDGSRNIFISNLQRKYPDVSKQQIEFLYSFSMGGAVSLIEEWVRRGMKDAIPPLFSIVEAVEKKWIKLNTAQ